MESKKIGNKTIYPKGSKKTKSKDNNKQESELVYKKGFRPQRLYKKDENDKEEVYENKLGKYSLFDNPMVENALKNMTPEQRERYRVFGEELYGKIDFKDNKILDKIEDPVEENAMIISTSIKSGLHPSFLDDNEKEVMKSMYGEEWFKHFGYESLEL